jgi:ATP-dependent DNA ligase
VPTSGDYSFELKWDGFRAIISTEGELHDRSRRGWDMTEHVGFLAELPVRAVLDGELVALDAARPLHSTPKAALCAGI